MILFTIGTNEQPFDRLVRAAAELVTDEELLVQYGSSRVAHGAGRWVEFMTFAELEAEMRAARAVVCHAGVGSIMLARRCGKRPIVVPRRVGLGEAVDDHQLPLARRLEARGIVRLVEDTADLPAALAGGDERPRAAAEALPNGAALAHDIRTYLESLAS
jgi:UDP-N-acetylglucosamine transferase subunit ALG13